MGSLEKVDNGFKFTPGCIHILAPNQEPVVIDSIDINAVEKVNSRLSRLKYFLCEKGIVLLIDYYPNFEHDCIVFKLGYRYDPERAKLDKMLNAFNRGR